MNKHKDFVIDGQRVELGETKDINLLVAKQFDFSDCFMPVKVIRGKEDGPRLFVSAAIHGDEVNGVEIIRRLLKNKSLKKLKGTLILAPIVNVFGFNTMSRYLPDRRDLNRCFPGSEKGSLASRLAHLFVSEILDNATHGIDLHTGSRHRTNLPQVRASLHDKEVSRLCHEFDVPVILNAELIEGSLRKTADKKKVPVVVFEGGETLRYNEAAIRTGLSGIVSVMQALDMIPKTIKKTKPIKSFIANGSLWERAPSSGVLAIKKGLGAVIKADDLLGVVSDPFGNHSYEIRAKQSGVIIGQNQMPLVNRGDALFHVATFNKTQLVSQSMEQFDDKFDYEER